MVVFSRPEFSAMASARYAKSSGEMPQVSCTISGV